VLLPPCLGPSDFRIIAQQRILSLGSALFDFLEQSCPAGKMRCLFLAPLARTMPAMSDLVINISWEFFLGILGSIIALAYYTNGRFTRLETNFEWLSDAIRDLTVKAENISSKVIAASSPVSLTGAGLRSLEDSGLKSYIDARKRDLVNQLRVTAIFDLYGVEESAFRLFAHISFDDGFARRLKKYAFESGHSTDLLRRIGAIYLRDVALKRN
jgi:hypothetical protein